METKDEILLTVKHEIQKESRESVASGALAQDDLFLIKRDIAKRAIVILKR